MSAIRRAAPFLVASLAGIVSGVYIFKPLILQETEKFNRGNPNQPPIIGSENNPKGQHSAKTWETQ